MSLIDIYRNRAVQDVERRLKERVKEIVRCYRHSWDIFSELIQNSVDAINRRYRILNDSSFYLYDEYRSQYNLTADQTYKGIIKITINVPSKIIQVEDNGVGIEYQNMGRFLLPEETGKALGREYGFKGYGLTFAAFISREFFLKSKFFVQPNTYEIGFDGLFDWLVDQDNNVPFPTTPTPTTTLSSTPLDGRSCNTVVKVRLEDNYETRFPAIAATDSAFEFIQTPDHWERFEYILRSRTAIGNTRPLFNQPPIVPIDVEVTVKFPGGGEENKQIEYRFFHPREHREIGVLSYDFADYVERLPQASFDRNFRGLYHALTNQSIGARNPIQCDIAILAASSTRLSNIESALMLDQVRAGDVGISYGVYLAINGMPTGIRIDDWDTRGADRKRYYVIVDAALDISNQLDSGRKGISRYYADLISSHVWDLITSIQIGTSDPLSRYASRYLDTGRVTTGVLPPQDFQQKVNAVRQNGEPLTASVLLEYSPTDEQEVIALFYELLSRQVIKGYKTVYLSSKATYDAAFDYEIECVDSNTFPHDSLGIGQLLVDQLRGVGVSSYVHRERYSGITRSAELCVEFKPTLGHFLEEVVLRPGRTSKDPDAIDLLIVWDSTIPPSIPSGSYTFAPIPDNQRIFHSTTHRLGLIGTHHTEIFCIVLKDVLQRMGT